MDFFIADLREYIGSLKQVENFTPFYKKYEVIEEDGVEYLVGHENINKERPGQYESPALLLAFVGIVQEPLPKYFKGESYEEGIRKSIPDKNILKFCKKFGLPYEGPKPGPVAKLEMGHLRFRVARLYYDFRLWHSLFSEDYDDEYIKRYAARLNRPGGVAEKVKKHLPLEIGVMLHNVGLFLDYHEKKDSFILGLDARDLITVAYFHLANLFTKEEKHVKQHLKTCNNPRCNRLFWVKHGNQRHCEYCDRRVVHRLKTTKEGKK